MLDKDLATLYGVETKVLNQTVKRNIERFPNDFRFELSKEECLRSQIVTSNGRGGNRYSTYAFTEQGVAMLSSRDIQKPIGVSDYELGQALPKDFRSNLPSIEEIEKGLNEWNQE